MAEAEAKEAIPEVYVAQARVAFQAQEFAKAESFLLRANKPQIILKYYKVS